MKNTYILFTISLILLGSINTLLAQDAISQVKTLVQKAEDCPNKQPTEGCALAERAIQIATNLHDDYWTARARHALAKNKFTLGDYSEVITIAEAQIPILEKTGTQADIADLYKTLYIVYNLTDGDKTQIYCDKAMRIFEALPDKNGQANCKITLGSVSSKKKGDKRIYLSHAEAAMSLYEATHNQLGIAECFASYGKYYSLTADFEKALDNFQRALTIVLKNNDLYKQARIYFEISAIYNSTANYVKGMEYAHLCLEISEKAGFKRYMSLSYRRIAETHENILDYTTAMAYYEKERIINEKIGDSFLIASGYTSSADVYRIQGYPTKAIIYLEKALDIFIKLGSKTNTAITYNNLGFHYITQSNYEKALACFKKGLSIAIETNNPSRQIPSYKGIWNVYMNCSDTVLAAEGIAPTMRYPKALEMAQKAADLNKFIKSADREKDIQLIRSQIYEKTNDYPKALDAYKKYIIFRDSSKTDMKLAITRKELAYQFDKKETVLKYEKQLTTEQLEKQKALTTQQQQTLMLNAQALLLANKEKDLQHLAFLNEQVEKQAKTEALSLSEAKNALQAADVLLKKQEVEKHEAENAQLQTRNRFYIGGIGALLLFVCLGGWSYFRLRQQKQVIDAQNQALGQLNSTKDKLFSIVAHDLRSPIGALKNHLTMTNYGMMSQGEFTTASKRLTTDVNSLYKSLDNLLLWAHSQQEGIKAQPETIHLHAIAAEQIKLLTEIAAQKNITVVNDISQEATAFADTNQIGLVIRNLVSNSLKFTKNGGKVVLGSKNTEGGKMELKIVDNGIGMSQAIQNQLFKIQGNASRLGTSAEVGQGLGLILVKEMVEANSGTFHIDSMEDKGTTISMVLN